MKDHAVEPTGCCFPLEPAPWQGKEIRWRDKLFIKDTIGKFLHIPLHGADNVTLSGDYLTRVFDGLYNAVPKWTGEMGKYAAQKAKR